MKTQTEQWNRHQLEDILLDITNGTTQNQSDDLTPYPVTRIETISNGVIDQTRVKYLKELSKNDIQKYRLQKGDVLFSHINSIEHIGKTAFYSGVPETLIHGMNLLRLRPDTKKIIPEYLYYLTNYEIFRNRVKSLAKKAINQASINQKEVGSIIVPVPPLVEQRGIAEVLGTADEAIRLTDQVIERTEALKQGLMQRLLIQGIGHTEFKDTPLGRIPKTWKISTIGNECKVGTGGTPRRNNPDYYSGEIPWVKSTELNYSVLYDTEEHITKKALSESNAKIYPIGTLLIAMYGLEAKGTRGRCAILGVDASTNQAIAAIQPKKSILPLFLYYFYQQMGDLIMKHAEGTKRKNLSLSIVKKIPIVVPTVTEQRKIIDVIQIQDEISSLENEKKKQFVNIKQGLMQDLLSGRVRVELREDGLHRVGDS